MRNLVIVAACFAMLACAKKDSPATTQTATRPTVVETPLEAPGAAPEPTASAERVKHPRVKDAAVYVDGKIVGFLKYHELPLGFEATYVRGKVGHQETEFGFASYVKALGIDLAKVRGLHLHGARVQMISGDDLRKGGDDIRFSFSGDKGGKPRPRLANGVRHKIDLNTTIDMISALAIYVDKEPPKEDGQYELVYADGSRVKGMAYAEAEASAGTRVYLDGKLVGIVKRKALSNDLLATNDLAKPEFSLKAYLAQTGVELAKTKSARILSNDAIAMQFDKSDALSSFTFSVPARNQGLAVIDIYGEAIRASAIQLFKNKQPPSEAKTSSAPSASKG